MNNKPLTIKIGENIDNAIKLLTSIPESALPVVDDDGKVVGELSQRDLLLKIIGKREMSDEDFNFEDIRYMLASKDSTIDDFYERHEFTLRPDDSVQDAVKVMFDAEISTIPIVDKTNKLLGILTDIKVLKHFKEISSK